MPAPKWDYDSVAAEASKYSRTLDFKKGSRGAYDWAERNGVVKELTAGMNPDRKPNKYWTKDRCLFIASYYEDQSDFIREQFNCYRRCSELGILEEAMSHMYRNDRFPKGHWKVKQNVIDQAAKFHFKADWYRGHPSSYQSAQRLGWLNDPEVTGHMDTRATTDNDAVYCWAVTSAANDDVVSTMPGYHLCKVGMTSAKLGDDRPVKCSNENGMGIDLIGIMQTPSGRATDYERLMLSMGSAAGVPSHYEGYTEFRIFSDSELDDMRQLLCA